MKPITSAVLLLASASSLAFPTWASAQSSAQSTTSAAPSGAQPAGQVGEVVVTGSRIIRNGNNSPTPVTVVTVQDLQNVQPTTISDNLNELPQFSGSRSQSGNPNPAGGNGAANELNLRNLGSNRNLILFDGHRVPPTLTDGTVDTDMIPQMLVQRVDIVTGGGSAVYGSDAISGVINFVPDKNFNGLKLQGQAGISGYRDDPTQDVGIAAGMHLSDRIHVEASYEYRNDDGILYRNARPWDNQWAAIGVGTTQYPYHLVSNVRLNTETFGGLITSGVLSGQTFDTNGVLSPFVHGTTTGSACCEIGGDGAYYNDSLKAPLRSHQMFARMDYDVTDSIHAYVDFAGDIKRNIQYLGPLQIQNDTFSSTNPFLSPAYQAQLAAAKQTTFKLSEFLNDSPRQEPESDAQQYMINAGITGKLGGYNWDLALVHGWTSQQQINHNIVNNDVLSAELDAVKDPATGNTVCHVTLTNPGLYPGCVPLNIFGPTAANAAAVNNYLGSNTVSAYTTMDDITGTVTGSPVSLWAGPVSFALTGEYRELTFRSTNSISSNLLVDCTGLTYNCTSGNTLWTSSGVGLPQVSQSVWETGAEFDAPLAKDLPLIQSLSVNGAVRYTDYSTVGDSVTWKVGLDWHLTDDFRVRATRSHDIRAPTLSELFSPQSRGTMTSEDYLTNTISTIPTIGGGNANLKPEIGDTTTGGFVWKPSFLPGFSASLDGYHIIISNALYSVMGSILAAQDACYNSGGTSPFCALQTRPFPVTNTTAANAVTSWKNIQINIASVETYGADMELNYVTQVFGHPISARMAVNYQPHLLFNTPGLLDLEHAGIAYSTNSLYPAPVWASAIFLHYKASDDIAIDMLEHWRAPMGLKDNPATVWANPGIKAFYTTNLNITYTVPKSFWQAPGKLDLFLNIANLFDATPPPAAFYSAQSQPGQFGGFAIGDDAVGRYFTLGARFRY